MRGAQDNPSTASACASSAAFTERHYAVAEIAARWNLSEDAVRRLFEREPGVLVLESAKRHKRQYRTLRIPSSVVERVYKKHLCV